MKASLCVEAAERPQWTTLLVEYSGEFRTGTRVGRAKLVQDWSDIYSGGSRNLEIFGVATPTFGHVNAFLQ